MGIKHSKLAARKPRTDALRNRERILEAAKRSFTRFGADATLDDIAKDAKVGPGTLYRHFPTRDALIEAVYRSDVEKLAAAERHFAQTLSPVEALRAWMLLLVDYIAAKHIIAPALNAVVGGSSRLYEGSRAEVEGAVRALVARAVKSEDIRKETEPLDLLRAIVGVAKMGNTADWQPTAKRLVDILIAGSQTGK